MQQQQQQQTTMIVAVSERERETEKDKTYFVNEKRKSAIKNAVIVGKLTMFHHQTCKTSRHIATFILHMCLFLLTAINLE
jgi:hypothetical protein